MPFSDFMELFLKIAVYISVSEKCLECTYIIITSNYRGDYINE